MEPYRVLGYEEMCQLGIPSCYGKQQNCLVDFTKNPPVAILRGETKAEGPRFLNEISLDWIALTLNAAYQAGYEKAGMIGGELQEGYP